MSLEIKVNELRKKYVAKNTIRLQKTIAKEKKVKSKKQETRNKNT